MEEYSKTVIEGGRATEVKMTRFQMIRERFDLSEDISEAEAEAIWQQHQQNVDNRNNQNKNRRRAYKAARNRLFQFNDNQILNLPEPAFRVAFVQTIKDIRAILGVYEMENEDEE
jgi:hypothetical protein